MARVIHWLIRGAVALLFVGAGIAKAWDIQDFALDVRNYQLTNWTSSIVIAVYLPWLEIFAGIGLLTRQLHRGALVILTTLTVSFLAAIASAWWRDLDITCGCFGPSQNQTNYPLHIVGNILLLAALIVLKTIPGSFTRSLKVAPLKSAPS